MLAYLPQPQLEMDPDATPCQMPNRPRSTSDSRGLVGESEQTAKLPKIDKVEPPKSPPFAEPSEETQSVDEEAQHLLEKFLARSFSGSRPGSSGQPRRSPSSEPSGLKRTADGAQKTNLPRGQHAEQFVADSEVKVEDQILTDISDKDKIIPLLSDKKSSELPQTTKDEQVNNYDGKAQVLSIHSPNLDAKFVDDNVDVKKFISSNQHGGGSKQRDQKSPLSTAIQNATEKPYFSTPPTIKDFSEKPTLKIKKTSSLLRQTASQGRGQTTRENPRMSSSELSSCENQDRTPSRGPVRRSRRSHAAPVNYYARPPGFGSGKDFDNDYEGEMNDDTQDMKSTEPELLERTLSPEYYNDSLIPSADSSKQHIRIIHSSASLRIQRENLTTTIPEMFDGYVCYHPQSYRAICGQQCARLDLDNKPDGEIVHADLDDVEMTSLYCLMTGQYGKHIETEEISIQDLIIKEARQNFRSVSKMKQFARRVKRIYAIYRSLVNNIHDPEPEKLLWGHLNGNFSLLGKVNSSNSKELVRSISRWIADIYGFSKPSHLKGSARLQKVLETIGEEELSSLISQFPYVPPFGSRKTEDIENFLLDASDGCLSSSPSLLRALSPAISWQRGVCSSSDLLRDRELGRNVRKGSQNVSQRLRHQTTENMRVWKSWKGASNDILVLSWSPDGTRFAAGAAAQSDEHNMQYNRNNNLLLGDLTKSSLRELPDHRIPRPRPATLNSGPNSQYETYNTTDPNLYMSVSAVQWSRPDRLYTASYDNTVKVWDTSNEAQCINTLNHPGSVQVMDVSQNDIVATGCEVEPMLSLWSVSNNGFSQETLPVIKSRANKPLDLSPSSLSWGTGHAKDVLVAGFSSKDKEDSDDIPRDGHLAVWEVADGRSVELGVSPNAQNIFDVSWHPSLPIFATGSTVPIAARTAGLSRDARSLIRLYDPLRSKVNILLYECPALDINDVTFCPTNSNYITASCTNGLTYVWDCRNAANILHKLPHGSSLSELDPSLTREQADVGVRLALWRKPTNQFFTGSSDGVLKEWNIFRSPEDVLVRNVESFGQEIMSGAFSPDYMSLLVGDSCGALHVLSSAPFSRDGDTSMNFIGATEPRSTDSDPDVEDLGIRIARSSLASGRLSRHPIFGVGQGPNYDGPYASWARPASTPRNAMSVTPLNQAVQALQLDGPPVSTRRTLDANERKHVDVQIQLASIRNARRGINKRKRDVDEHSYGHSERRHSPISPPRTETTPIEEPTKGVSLVTFNDGDYSDDDDNNSEYYDRDSGDDQDSLSDVLQDDHWFPPNWAVDPNVRNSDV